MTPFKKFIGKDWFAHCEAIDAIAKRAGLLTNLKVSESGIDLARRELLDLPEFESEDDQLTVLIQPNGTIISIHVG